MRVVLLVGAAGNLGLRLVPALEAHGNQVVAFVRSPDKLRASLSSALISKITIHQGDASDSSAVETALEQHNCDVIVHTARSFSLLHPVELDELSEAVASAAIRVGKRRGGEPLRAWFVSGLTLMTYPGTKGYRIQDFFPWWLGAHHRSTSTVIEPIPLDDLYWSILCVAFMVPAQEDEKVMDVWPKAREYDLAISTGTPPQWRDHWVRWIPFVGVYLNLFPVVKSYETKLEDVADFLAHDVKGGGRSWLVGDLVGLKDDSKLKSM